MVSNAGAIRPSVGHQSIKADRVTSKPQRGATTAPACMPTRKEMDNVPRNSELGVESVAKSSKHEGDLALTMCCCTTLKDPPVGAIGGGASSRQRNAYGPSDRAGVSMPGLGNVANLPKPMEWRSLDLEKYPIILKILT
ncbi:unnamed protein product [Darwinula stevensoni]|uniref:Uncharacterized protein n=1 Tax=Darwinula stevensoni TaxID=69355 RepID=A0A7R8XCZ3_9CRUS|nr:unnamed protein product [Darwinula stevensoni]CAG0892470.1 unnamed protein product [Darwinula stevensoni]